MSKPSYERSVNVILCLKRYVKWYLRAPLVSHRLLDGHLSVRLDVVLQTVELPAGVPHLDASLAYVDGDAFTLGEGKRRRRRYDIKFCMFNAAVAGIHRRSS